LWLISLCPEGRGPRTQILTVWMVSDENICYCVRASSYYLFEQLLLNKHLQVYLAGIQW
jgi:hypothetical protein